MARGLAVVVSVAISSAGCAQLAGIDETSGDARGGNAVELTHMSIGTQIVTTPVDLTKLQATYLVPNPANASGVDRVLAANAGQGRWTVDLPAAAAVALTFPSQEGIPQLFAFPNRELKVLFAAFEHANREPAPIPAMLNLIVNLDAPTDGSERFQIFTVGSWSERDLGPAEVPVMGSTQVGPVVYDFQSSRSLSGRPELDRLTAQDAFLVLRYVGTNLTGFAEAAPFEQTGDDIVAATLQPVVADKILDVRLDPARLATRYAAVRPAVSDLQIGWALHAAPGFALGPNIGPSLQSGTLAATELGLTVSYVNPFTARDWNTVFTLSTTETRVYTPPGTTTPVTLAAGMFQFIEPTLGFDLTLPAGLPELISLDGKPLSTDGQTLARPTKFVEVTFIADAPDATLYSLQVFDLVANATGTGLELQLVLFAASSEAKFQIPPETFQPGHSYTLRAVSQLGGLPGIASGDFVPRTLPFSRSFLDSAVITVTP
jgi:hypothetical protein